MSYPPTPDPLSVPSSRTNNRVSQASVSSYYPDEADAADQHLSSADAYSPVASHSGIMGDWETREGAHSTSPGLGGGPFVGGEMDPMLRARGDPLTPPTGFQDEPDRRSHTMGEESYAAYSDHGASRHPSSMNLSFNDGDSQRNLYDAPAPLSGRRGSNLQYGSSGAYDDAEKDGHDSERGAAAAGGMSDKGRRLARGGGGAGGRRKPGWWASLSSKARKLLIAGLILLLIIIVIAVAVPTAMSRSNSNSSSANDNAGEATTTPTRTTTSVTPYPGVPTGVTGSVDWGTAAFGGDGSTVYTEDGGSFTYNNTFGGFWNAIPFNNTAQSQADSPPLTEECKPGDYENDLIQGVNVGGWLVIEPFIAPGLFEPFSASGSDPNGTFVAVDEWTLCEALGTDMAATIEEHYRTFITEKDFAEIAAAGLNWVRLPVPFWIVEVYEGEPFLANVGWTYFLKAITWARKYGLRINLDLHAVPGSQNGYNHSSKLGTINFLNGVMGLANAQRTLNVIRTLTEFISQPQYRKVVPMFSIMNEPYAATIGIDLLRHFYLETYNVMRNIGGIGEGNGPFISYHDGFTAHVAQSIADGGWNGFLPGADRVAIDTHPYLCFSPPNNDGLAYQAMKPCTYWANDFNTTAGTVGLSMGAEWSLAINDCGKWINNVGNGQRFEGTYYIPGQPQAPQFEAVGSCDVWNDWENYTAEMKAGLMLVASAHMDALRHFFFWTWKTGYSTELGKVANPMWNYQLGLENGWMPTNPRTVVGMCPSIVAAQGETLVLSSAATLQPWMTGGAGAGTMLDPAQTDAYTWPPSVVGNDATPISNLPTYTQTGGIVTLPVSVPTSYPSGYASFTNAGDGWQQSADTAGYYTPVAGCTYPDPWQGVTATIPDAPCTGVAQKMRRQPSPAAPPAPTAAPSRR